MAKLELLRLIIHTYLSIYHITIEFNFNIKPKKKLQKSVAYFTYNTYKSKAYYFTVTVMQDGQTTTLMVLSLIYIITTEYNASNFK
jgi:hypothetical protein